MGDDARRSEDHHQPAPEDDTVPRDFATSIHGLPADLAGKGCTDPSPERRDRLRCLSVSDKARGRARAIDRAPRSVPSDGTAGLPGAALVGART